MKKTRIYILPTRFGLVFLVSSILMIFIGSAYQNNLVNMLAFFMLSLIFIGMIQTHNNLRFLQTHSVESDGGFADQEFVVTTIVANPAKDTRHGIEARAGKLKARAVYENTLPLIGHGKLRLRSAYPSPKRGVYKIERVRVSSTYPLGLFEAWSWQKADGRYSIFPAPKGERPFPIIQGKDEEGRIGTAKGGDDFRGHRRFVQGDSDRHVDWKASARGRARLVKEFNEGTPGAYHFDWRRLESLGDEEKLSQLSSWVQQAKDRNSVFSLSLPGLQIPPGQGRDHARRCWEALAAFPPPPRSSEAK